MIGAALILKSIPFRLSPYGESRDNIYSSPVGFSSMHPLLNKILLNTGLLRTVRYKLLDFKKMAYTMVDAHVNYVEAFDLWSSYGVPKEKIFITRNSPDTDMLFDVYNSLEHAPPILPKSSQRFLHVGRLVKWKRVDMLLYAFSRIREDYPDVELIVIGGGPEEEILKGLSKQLMICDSVCFLGPIYDQKILGQYYLASSVYVLAGMGGLSINEAMCFGLPVLCSVCDGTERVLVRDGFNGIYFSDDDEDDLVSKLVWFLENSFSIEVMGCNSRKIIREDVNIHTVINGYLKAFEYVYKK